MDDIVKSIKAFLYDRTVSPLFGAYASAWCLWNYRIFVALLDDGANLTSKMDFIDAHFGVVTYNLLGQTYFLWGHIVHGILGPLLLTLIYLFVYPWLAKPVYEYSLKRQKELREVKQAAEELRLLSPEESRNLIKEIEQLRQKADADEQAYRKRIASLTESINALESNKTELESSNQTSSNQTSSNQAIDEHSKAVLSTDELGNFVRSRIEEIPNGEFQLSDLFEPDEWQKMDESSRKVYGKLFRKLVERGDFDDVSINRKGSANQLVYLKNAGSMFNDLHEFQEYLFRKIRLEYFPKANGLDKQLEEQLRKVAEYCVKNRISKEMLEVLMLAVFAGAEVTKDNVVKYLSNEMSPIEVDVVINKLERADLLIKNSFGKLKLSSKGKEIAVESGLTVLNKTLSQ